VIVDPPKPVTFKSVPADYNGVNISCNGLSDGVITIIPVTGTEPYRYFLKKPDGSETESTTPVFSNLRAGQYLLSVIDSNYCTTSDTVLLSEPGKLYLQLKLSESKMGGYNLNCAGQSTGTIDINAFNAVLLPEYIWSDGFFGSLRKDLPAGRYSVVAIDGNNCRAAADTTLTEPPPLKLSVENLKQPFCPDKPDGEISIIAEGGVKGTDYTYLWSDNSTASILTGVAAGEYTVVVTDMNGCTISLTQKMVPLNKTCLRIPNAITPNGDTKNDVWNIGEIDLYPQAEVKIFNRLGQLVWRSEKGYPTPWDGTSNGKALPFDAYHYVIDLHNNSKPFIGSITIIR
jgi:gliding motility-associated-like protein